MPTNRTGIRRSEHADAMREVTEATQPTSGDHARFVAAEVTELESETAPIGSIPPRARNGKGGAAANGERLPILLDKIGERLCFERTGTRLYEALLRKLDAKGGFEDGPTREDLQTIRDEEERHLTLLVWAMEELGGDPTAVTPSADLAAVESSGIAKVIQDPRTTMAESLHAILIAELADHDGWTLLAELAEELGQDALAREFSHARQEEQRHLEDVRDWVSDHAIGAAS